MPDFNARPDSLNVEQIMDQIRARIREKRGVDYEEQQIHELAKAKLDQLLDPRTVQTDLLERLKKLQPSYAAPQLPAYEFEDSTLFESTRPLLRFIRRLLNPLLKVFFNPNPLIGALHTQARLNAMYAEREAKRDAMRLAGDQLFYQVLHNLLLEMTRSTLEVKNLRMRVESIGSRLEFNERRARALESAAFAMSSDKSADRPSRAPAPPTPLQPSAGPAATSSAPSPAPPQAQGQPADVSASRSRRRRRRRGRRGGGSHGPSAPTAVGEGAVGPAGARASAAETSPPAATTSPKDDLQTFTGAAAHPSEPEIPSPSTDTDDQ